MTNSEKIIIGTTGKGKPIHGYYDQVMKAFVDKNPKINNHVIMSCTSGKGKHNKKRI
ncbi:hypothetical protein [Mammaliicoccus sciuri]|uniref:hypothetical protein n=1 Tax=Mammaliicoccus sciuri TaxID=1296 RepID=UPI003F556DAF